MRLEFLFTNTVGSVCFFKFLILQFEKDMAESELVQSLTTVKASIEAQLEKLENEFKETKNDPQLVEEFYDRNFRKQLPAGLQLVHFWLAFLQKWQLKCKSTEVSDFLFFLYSLYKNF